MSKNRKKQQSPNEPASNLKMQLCLEALCYVVLMAVGVDSTYRRAKAHYETPFWLWVQIGIGVFVMTALYGMWAYRRIKGQSEANGLTDCIMYIMTLIKSRLYL